MHQNTSELTLASIALDIGAPPPPPKVPSDPAMAVENSRNYLARCKALRESARTAQERLEYDVWVINAENELIRWEAALARQGR